jgi:hypothetical protein
MVGTRVRDKESERLTTEATAAAGKAIESAGVANERAASANLKAEELRKKNFDLERAVSPRMLEQRLTSTALRRFSDVAFVVVSENDYEQRRTAGQIRWMLREARWKDYNAPRPSNLHLQYSVGVTVRSWFGGEAELGSDAKDALVKILNDNGIQAQSGAPLKELGSNVVLVIVGPKPFPRSLEGRPDHMPTDVNGGSMWGNISE